MPFQSPLTAAQLVAHRGSDADTTVYSARVNQNSFTTTVNDLTYDGGSGTLANVLIGMVIILSHTSDPDDAFFRGRIRKTPTATHIYFNDSSAAFADNDYIWVLESIKPSYWAETYISLNANAVIYSARINQSSFTKPCAELAIDGGSGTLADVMVGMTVLISHTNDKASAFFRGRVRKMPTSSLLYHNETGAPFSEDDYVWILDDFDAHIKLPRWGGQILLDWENVFAGLPPIISDVQAAYAGEIDPDTDVFSQTFAPTVVAAQTGETISSYLWTVPSGVAITVGSTTTKNITAEFDEGEYWIHLTATDSAGTAFMRHIKVWAHGPNFPPTLLTIDNISLSCELPIDVKDGASSGYSATFDAFDSISTVLDRTLACVWVHESYNEIAGSQVGNIALVGRLRSERDSTTYGENGKDASATVTIEGPLAILASIDAPSFEMDDGAGASDVVLTIETLTLWRGIWTLLSMFSTFGEVYPVAFSDVTTAYRYPRLVTQGSDMLASLGDLAQSIDAVVQMAPDGRIEFPRRAIMLSSGGRNALSTIANLDIRDILETIDYERDFRPTTARIMADGGGYDGVSNVSAYIATAPPGAPEDAPEDSALPRQILTTAQSVADEQAELSLRAGNAFAAAQPPKTLRVKLHDGWRWLTPAVDQWYTFTFDGSELMRGLVLTTATRWWLQAVDLSPDPKTGQVEVNATFIQETQGSAGEIIPYAAVDTGLFGDLTDFGQIDELPFVDTSLLDWNFAGNDGGFIILQGVYTPGTGYEGTCATSRLFVDIYKDLGTPQTIKRITISYDATYTGGATNLNKVYIRPSATAAWQEVKTWTTVNGASQQEIVDVPNLSAQQVRVIAYGSGADCSGAIVITAINVDAVSQFGWDITFDWTAGQEGWSIAHDATYGDEAIYTASTGFEAKEFIDAANDSWRTSITHNTPSSVLTYLDLEYDCALSPDQAPPDTPVLSVTDVLFGLGGTQVIGVTPVDGSGQHLFWTGNHAFTGLTIASVTALKSPPSPGVATPGQLRMIRARLKGMGANPFS